MPLPPVRFATEGDAEAVLELLRLMHGEAPAGAWAEARAREQIADCLANGAVLLSLSDGRPVACMGLVCGQFWWSEEWHLGEKFLFVHPAHRRAPHARSLLAQAKAAAAELGLPLVCTVFSTRRTAGKVRLFTAQLGDPVGALFLISPASAPASAAAQE